MPMKTDIEGINQIRYRVKMARTKIEQPAGAWKKVGSFLSMVERKQWATAGGYLGKPWKPLKPDYLQWKIRSGYSKRTLMKTGALRLSLVSRPMAIERYYKKSAVFGTNVEYAKYHQYGTRKMARRQLINKNPKIVRGIKHILMDYFSLGSRTTVRRYI
jgi:phage gpG-like protein